MSMNKELIAARLQPAMIEEIALIQQEAGCKDWTEALEQVIRAGVKEIRKTSKPARILKKSSNVRAMIL